NAARTINVVDSGFLIRELQIDAVINGGGATGAINSTGTGILVLNANNSAALSGGVTLNGGNVAAGNNNAFGTGTVNVAANSLLLFNTYGAAPSTINIANPITLNADLTLRGDNNFNLSGSISGQGAANRSLNLNMNNAATATLSGTINPSNNTA